MAQKLPRKRFLTGEFVLRSHRTDGGAVDVKILDTSVSPPRGGWITLTETEYKARLDPVFVSDEERSLSGSNREIRLQKLSHGAVVHMDADGV